MQEVYRLIKVPVLQLRFWSGDIRSFYKIKIFPHYFPITSSRLMNDTYRVMNRIYGGVKHRSVRNDTPNQMR